MLAVRVAQQQLNAMAAPALRGLSAMAAMKASEELVLYGFPTSSTSVLTRFALNLRGVAYREETLKVTTRADGRPDAAGKKPYLEANGRMVATPGSIFNFVNELPVSGPSLLPEDAVARSQARRLATLSATEIAPFGFYRVDRFLADRLKVDKAGLDAWHKHWLEQGFQQLEDILRHPEEVCVQEDQSCTPPGPGTFLVGDAPSMADVFVMPQVHWSQGMTASQRPDLTAYPILNACYQNALKLDAFKKALPNAQH